MLRSTSLAAALAVSLAPLTADAAPSETQYWLGTLFTARFTGESAPPARDRGLSGWLDVQGRRTPDRVVNLLRPALGYRLDGSLSLWGGYAYIPTLVDDKPNVIEHRIWEQGLWQRNLGPFLFQVRPRLEQRFREGQDGVNHRARLFVRANVRFSPDHPLGIALWDEPFFRITSNSWAGDAGFDQNRLFIGPAWTTGPIRTEAGYLNVQIMRNDQRQTVHAAFLLVLVSL